MTENLLLLVIATLMAGIQEFILHPLLVKINWKDEMTFPRRILISWPILSFLLYGVLLVSYVMFYQQYPQGFRG